MKRDETKLTVKQIVFASLLSSVGLLVIVWLGHNVPWHWGALIALALVL